MKWAAMEFLLKATRESRGKKKLKYIIILTCRALAIAMLVFAISRPLVGGFFGWGGATVDTVVLILDRSASMEQQLPSFSGTTTESKRSSAIASIQQSLGELNNPRLILIDSASGKAQDVPSPDVLDEISAVSATDTRAPIPALITSAIDYIIGKPLGAVEIWVASDLQESDWSPELGSWDAIRTELNELPQQTTLRILSLTAAPKDNTSIRILSSRRSGDDLILDIELLRTDDDRANTSIPINYNLNGAESTSSISITGQSYQFQKRLPIGELDTEGYGYVSIPADTNTRDNVSYFAYGKDAPTKTYLISEGGESARWLELASAPPGFGRNECIKLTPDAAHEIDWLNTSLVIWQAALPDTIVAQELTRYLESGGALLLFPTRAESTDTFLGMQWGNQITAPRDQFLTISNWEKNDGPLRNGADGTEIPASKFKAIIRKEILGDSTVLASWEDDSPFLVRRVQGDGTAIFVTSLPDYRWSNLADADVLLPLVQRMITLGNARFGSAFAAITGSSSAQPTNEEVLTRLDDYSTSNTSNAIYEAGVWKVGDRLLATNRPKSEDEWQIVPTSELNTLLEGTTFKLFEDKSNAASDSLAREIWRAFLIAMLVFLITEAVLCLQPPSTKVKK